MTGIQSEIALAALEKFLQTKSNSALIKFWQLYPKAIPSWHLPMMNDHSRNVFYEKEIQASCSNKIVLDLGAGVGLLTQMALDAGAKHIYALEQDPVIQQCFKHAFKEELATGRITLLEKNSLELKLEDFILGHPEIVIHEIFGKSLFDERVVETFTDLFQRKIFVPTMKFIPQKCSLWACLGKQTFESKIKDERFANRFWFLENISYFGKPAVTSMNTILESEDVSEKIELFRIDLKQLPEKIEVTKNVEARTDGNLLRVWFELHGEQSNLTTDIRNNKENHWGNSSFFLLYKAGKVNLGANYSNGKLLIYNQNHPLTPSSNT